jgi:hypothetical protein
MLVQEKVRLFWFVEEDLFISIGAGNSAGSGANNNPPIHTGHRRQQYTLAELPYVCEFCPARYKTKPGLQYHLAKHKDINTEHRPSSSTPSTGDTGGSLSPTSANASAIMKQKYMNPPIDHHQQQQQPMYTNQSMPGGPVLHNNTSGHLPLTAGGVPSMPTPPYPMNPHHHHHHQQQQQPYGMPPQPHHHSVPPSASMPLTVAALSGSAPPTSVPYYPQQQHQMAHQQHMMMMQQQHHHHHQQQQQQQHFQQPPKQSTPSTDLSTTINTGIQCDFCGGNEQENKTTKLPEQMITCKVI